VRKMRWLALAGLAVAVLPLAVLVAACGSDEGEVTGIVVPTATQLSDVTPDVTEPTGEATPVNETVDVAHGEWYVDTSQDTVDAGTVTFNVTNTGKILHNFKVARTDLDPGALPVDTSTSTVDETQLDILAASSDLAPGELQQVVVDLPPGHYVLFCNIASHYQAGVYTGFTVK
jgi:uncharacterized cupredoxin-like copper-binding protein